MFYSRMLGAIIDAAVVSRVVVALVTADSSRTTVSRSLRTGMQTTAAKKPYFPSILLGHELASLTVKSVF